MLRLKSTLLIKIYDTYYYQSERYNGIVFFDKGDFIVENFYVENGILAERYHPYCQFELPSPIQIDCSTFTKEYPDYNCDIAMIPQLYQGKAYEGIGYMFEGDICIYEAYFNRLGQTECVIWFNEDGSLFRAELEEVELKDYLKSDDYGCKRSSSFYISRNRKENYVYQEFSHSTKDSTIDLHVRDGFITEFHPLWGGLPTSYESFELPFVLPEIASVLEKAPVFPFAESVEIELTEVMNQFTIEDLAKNGSFLNVKQLFLYQWEEYSVSEPYNGVVVDLDCFAHRENFPQLETISFYHKCPQNCPKAQIEEIERFQRSNKDIKILVGRK